MTPAEWLEILVRRLDERWKTLGVYDAYYEGDQILSYATKKFRDVYGGLFTSLTDNWMPIVVDATAERLRVQGFRFGENTDADKDAWAIWQANGLDAEANMLHTEAIKLSEAYWMVQPNGDVPRITAEHPSQVIVACAPGDRRTRLAALKKWQGEDGWIYANVYLPDRIVKYKTKREPLSVLDLPDPKKPEWETIGASANPLGVVPIVPAPNNPSMIHGGRSDLAGGPTRIQDAINKLLADMLVGSEYQAFPQRVLLGVEQPKDAEGKPIPMSDIQKTSQGSRLWMFPSKEAKAFEFKAADLKNFRESIDGLIRDLTAQTRTPPHYVSGQIVNASGDALKAAETGLVSKVRDKMDPFGEAHEEAMRLAFKSIGDEEKAAALDAETIWKDPESRTQAETVDAVTKEVAIGLPLEVAFQKIGYSPQEVDRIMMLREAEGLLTNFATNAEPQPEGATPNGPERTRPNL